MSDENGDREVDPRYDPVFQRGFGGEVVDGLTRRPPSRLRPVTVPSPTNPPVATPAALTPAVLTPASVRAAPRESVQEAPAPGPELVSVRRPPWKNPFLIALLIVGVGLIGGALTIANNYVMHRGSGVSRTDDAYLFVVLTQYGAPTTAILGMATIIGVVFVFAIEWQRRGR